MEKKLTRRQIISYFIYFTLACVLVLGIIFARYKSTVAGTGTVSTASVALGGTAELSRSLKDMKPGDTKVISVSVTNKEGDTLSEVTQDYSITIKTTGNLPLKYELAVTGNDAEGNYAKTKSPDNTDRQITWKGGRFPHSKDITHTYELTVTWPKENADETYAEEIDKVTLVVNAEQTQAAAN